MSNIIDYQTNIRTADGPARWRAMVELEKAFGYLPVYAPTMPDFTLGRNLLAHIIGAYPGYRWVVEVRDTVISVVNETLSPDWGFRLKENMLDNDGKVIKSFAGQLLEQYNVRAGKIDRSRLAELPKTPRGNVKRIGQ